MKYYIIENKSKDELLYRLYYYKISDNEYSIKYIKDNYSQEINYKIDNGILYNKYFRDSSYVPLTKIDKINNINNFLLNDIKNKMAMEE